MPDFDKSHPEVGFYRGQRQEAVAIWRDTSGKLLARVLTRRPDGSLNVDKFDDEAHIAEHIFSFCCRRAIEHDEYLGFLREVRWPEDIERTDRNESGEQDPLQSLDMELADLLQRANAFTESIHATVGDDVSSDRVANYGIAIADVEKRANAAREAEVAPHLEAQRKANARWRDLLDRASKGKANLKGMLTSYLSAKKAKALAEQEAAEAKAREQRKRGEPVDLPRAQPSAATAGTQGRVSLRSRTVYEVNDVKALFAFLASLNNPPADAVEACRKAGEKLARAGMTVPGLSARIEEYSA
jgi:hypothetical protein